MRILLISLFTLISHLACADLRQALNDFERGYYQYQESLPQIEKELTDLNQKLSQLATKTEDPKGIVANLKKAIQAKIDAAIAKKLNPQLQSAADEFMRLRKRGATIPIAYLEFLQQHQLAKITEPIRWEEPYFQQMKTTREHTYASSPYKEALQIAIEKFPVPEIPAVLIIESQESLTSSLHYVDFLLADSLNERLEIAAKIADHFMNSIAANQRVIFHLYLIIRKIQEEDAQCKKLSKKSATLGNIIASFKSNFKNLPGYFGHMLTITDEKSAPRRNHPSILACSMDPDFMNIYNWMIPHAGELQAAYDKADSEAIAKAHLTRSAAYFKPPHFEIVFVDALSAYQNGSCLLPHKWSLTDVQFTTITPASLLSNASYPENGTKNYFAFIAHHCFGCAAGKLSLSRSFLLADAEDRDITPQTSVGCYQAYLNHPDPRTKEAQNLLDIAVKAQVPQAMLERARLLFLFPKTEEDLIQAYRSLKKLLRMNHPDLAIRDFRILIKGLLAQAYLIWGIGDPVESYTYIKYAYDNFSDLRKTAPPKGLYAYFVAKGIGCKKDPTRAQRIAAEEKIPSGWAQAISLDEKMQATIMAKDMSTATMHFVSINRQSGAIEQLHYELPKTYYIKKYLDYVVNVSNDQLQQNPISYEFVKLVVEYTALIISENVYAYNEYAIRQCYLTLAEIFVANPELHNRLRNDHGDKIKTAEEYISLALKANMPAVHLFIAKSIWQQSLSYHTHDREADLEKAIDIVSQHKRKGNLDDKIFLEQLKSELKALQTQQQIPNIVVNDDEPDSEAEDDDSEEEIVNVTSTAACSSTDVPVTKKVKVKTRKQSDMTMSYSVEIPAAKATKKVLSPWKLTDETQGFVNMVYGFGDKRIHDYKVEDAESVFNNIGMARSKKDRLEWTYEDADGLVHKLSFHAPHGRGEDLYLAIRKRIKHFFMRIGLTPAG